MSAAHCGFQGQDARLKLGEGYHLLKGECEPYEKSPDTGLTYNKSVAKTGLPRPTAERYRLMFETKQEYGVPGDTFLMLSAEGLNLADLKASMKRHSRIHRPLAPENSGSRYHRRKSRCETGRGY